MTLGPLEYVVIGFRDDRIDGSVAREIEKVVDANIIRLIDVVFIAKDRDGKTLSTELDYKSDPAFAPFERLLSDRRLRLFTTEDLKNLAETMPEGTAGLALLFEHRWSEDIKDAMAAHGGFLVARTVIQPEVLEELSAELDALDLVTAG